MAVTDRELVEPRDHVVNLYDSDEDLVADVIDHLVEGLLAGEAAIVVATAEHRAAFAGGLRQRGVDVEGAVEAGRYLSLDAAGTLAGFMIDGMPDRDRFMAAIGSVISEAAAQAPQVRAFGEMVALLWDAGNVAGAIALEALWNELGCLREFSLYCAYPMALLAENDDLAALHQVCAHHSSLVAPRSYGSLRPAPVPEPGSVERTELFLPVPLAVRVVRRFVAETLSSWGEDDLADDLVVVASELATNAVAHASCPFRVTMRLSSTAVLIAVEDRSPTLPLRLDPPEDAGGGRGILLVSSLCTNWGTEPGSSGKVVWGELARSATE